MLFITDVFALVVIYLFFFFFDGYFLRETECKQRKTERESEREKERESKTGSRIRAVSTEPVVFSIFKC